MFTFLGDYQANPTGANPYMVLTCFDELVATKGIVMVRGDLISHLNEDEGQTIMSKLISNYLRDSDYDTIKKFNHDSDNFKYQEYINESLSEF